MKPVFAVGGLGGSGTRVVARILQKAGFFIGGDLNQAFDNLWYTLLFKRPEILQCDDEELDRLFTLFAMAMGGEGSVVAQREADICLEHLCTNRLLHGENWLRNRRKSMQSAFACDSPGLSQPWGWKEPNTHLLLPEIASRYPNILYVHVLRHGLDMAISTNQNQLRLWGDTLLERPCKPIPEDSFEYWCVANRRVREISVEMGVRTHLVRYEDLCRAPQKTLGILFDALVGHSISKEDIDTYAEDIHPPERAIGRFKSLDLSRFPEYLLDELTEWGYEI